MTTKLHLGHFILIILATLPVYRSLLRPGYFPMHDDMQAMRLLQMHKCFVDGQIPCRWVPDMGYGYGYPQFNYYNPLPYYVMEVFHLGGLGYLDSVKAGLVFSVLLAAIAMFLLGRELWGTAGGFVSALFYLYLPYRAVDMYVRGAVGEFFALGFLPLIFWSSKRIIDGDRKSIFLLAVSLAGLFTSHNVTSMVFMPVFVLWLIFIVAIKKYKESAWAIRDACINLFLGSVWGFLLSAFFILPALTEQRYVHIETMLQGYFNYLAHFVSLKQIFLSPFWGYGSSELGDYDEMSLSVGLFHWLIPSIILAVAILKKNKPVFIKVGFLLLGAYGLLFLMHQKSTFIWNSVSYLAYIQFPWRILGIAGFMFSLAAGAFAKIFNQESLMRIATGVLVMLVVMFNISYFRTKEWLNINDTDKFGGESWEKQLTISIFDYLPKSAKFPPAGKAFEKPVALDGSELRVEGKKGSNWQQWIIQLEDNKTVIFPIYYFPNWKATVNQHEKTVAANGELGLVSLNLDAGRQEVKLNLVDTPVRSLGNILTFAGLALIPVFFRKIRYR